MTNYRCPYLLIFAFFGAIIFVVMIFNTEQLIPQIKETVPINANDSTADIFDTSKIRLLTAFSGDHFGEALKSCQSIAKLQEVQDWKPGYMIAYLLKDDIKIGQMMQYLNECPFVTLRILNTTKYPAFIQDLYEYRWKAIIVEEVLKEAEKVFYFDSSVVFKGKSDESLKDIFNKMDTKFDKCGIREFDGTIHSIYSATHPNTLQRFNFSVEIAKNNTMYGATLLVATRAASEIIKKWKECALEKECMAPEGSHRACDIPKLYKNEYGNCHRFDQSVLALLLYNCSKNAIDYVESSPLISVERSGSPPP